MEIALNTVPYGMIPEQTMPASMSPAPEVTSQEAYGANELIHEVKGAENGPERLDSMIGHSLENTSRALNQSAQRLMDLSKYIESGRRISPSKSLEFLSIINTYSIQCHCVNTVGKNISDGTKTLFRNQ